MATMARVDHLPIAVPAAIAVAWVAVLAQGPGFGAITYAIPLLCIAAGLVAITAAWTVPHHARVTVLLYVFALFALNLNFRQRELGVTGLDWQNGTKLAVWLAILILAWTRRSRLGEYLMEPLLGLMAIYSGMALVSAGWSDTPSYTAASAIGLVAYLLLACLVVAELGVDAALRLTVWTLVAFVALGVIGGLVAPDIAWLPPSVEETFHRLQGFSGHPNVFAQQIGILITLLAIARRSKLIALFPFLILLALGVFAIVATGSRTTLAAVTVAWAIIALRDRHRLGVVLLAGTVVTAVVLMAAGLGALSSMHENVAELSRTGTASEIFTLTGRTEVWGTVWSLIQEKPFLGWGYNGTEDLISASMYASFTGTAINAHNMALQSLVSMGFLGTLPLFAFGALLVFRFFTAADSGRDQIMAYTFCIGLGEVAISASPVLLTLMVFVFLAREAEQGRRHARKGIRTTDLTDPQPSRQ